MPKSSKQDRPVGIGRVNEWMAGRIGRKADRSYRVRIVVQVFFAVVCILIGLRVVQFYLAAQAGHLPLPARPPGVDAFLPISGLMGILDWAYQGSLNRVHPAATVLVVVALAMAFFFRKSFCSWMCPVGLASELLARFGRWAFGRNFRPWKWIDIPLRGIKYLLMAFFVGAVLTMGASSLQAFITSPYNQVADIKMGLFFLDMSRVGVITVGVLVLSSVFVEGAWCRYGCPYGALLGLFSWFSPTRITRTADSCVDCGLCDRACPARLPISTKASITSPECTGCMDCLAVCPVANTLELTTVGRRKMSPLAMAAAVMGLFFAGYLGARVTGNWDNDITDEDYVEHVRGIRSARYGHPGG